jgi:hypothetical protein
MKTVHSVLYMKKTELSADDQDTDTAVTGVLTPEIEIREVNRNIIISIHCEKKKSLLVKSFAELEKLQLTVVNASILSFSETTVDLTVK